MRPHPSTLRRALAFDPIPAQCVAISGMPGRPPRFREAFAEVGEAFAYASKERLAGEETIVEAHGKRWRYDPARPRGGPA